jgi:hypothetical protein
MSLVATGNRNFRRVIRLVTLRKPATTAREVWLRRFMLFEIINHTKALEKLPCIWDIPIDMTVCEFDSIMSYLIENNIPRSEYANVFKTGIPSV